MTGTLKFACGEGVAQRAFPAQVDKSNPRCSQATFLHPHHGTNEGASEHVVDHLVGLQLEVIAAT